ncbi:aspartate--tRNA(Asn) ligase [Candidatus Micrarchaeota archaeon]|nr:aspartate--tRNA(Asn) ligase [Candidatus Micrarchaeota archaeon]
MDRTHYISEAKKKIGSKVGIAGWVHDVRDLGKLKFVHVRDATGILQVTMKKGVVEDSLLESVSVNKEEVVAFEGEIRENKIAPDGVEMVPNGFRLLNRVDRKLPVDPTGHVPSELDTRLDYRYIDLRKREVGLIFRIKSSLITSFREHLVSKGFVEIQPSAITGAATEGGTEVFPVQYFETQAYLVQSPQLYKQLAVIGGLDRVMITMPVFRAEKHSTTTHLNEITQMDIEMGFADHLDVMDILESVTQHMLEKAKKEFGGEMKTFETEIKIPKKIPRHTYTKLVDRLNSEKFGMKFGEDFSKEAEKKIYDILGEELYFIYDWPTSVRAFYSMPDEKNEELCHAFDLVYRGLEIASGAKRIHLVDILERQLKKRGMNPANFEFYLDAFRMGAPPHAGWSIGLERLAMKLCNQSNIREAMLFPRDRMRLSP